MEPTLAAPSRLSDRSALLIIAYGATISLVHFGPTWVLTYHEAYFAEPAREMLRSGDWLIPRMAGIPSWQKPPLTHWMIAATMGLLRTEAEWAVRVPSLICTILNAIFVAAMAARWHGDRVGRLAGLIGLTTYYALFQGRLAESDMPLCASVSGAMLALAVGTIDRERCGWGPKMAFFGAAGLSSLIKGPFGLGLIGVAAGLFAIIEGRRTIWRFLLDPLGWIVMLVLTLTWPIAAYRTDPTFLDALRVHNLDRFSGAYDGQKNPFFYAYIIPALLLPWTPLAFGGLFAGWRDRACPGSLWRLMACWMVVGLALISASAWKHKHYPIPLLPPMSIAAAYGLDRYVREARRSGRSPAAIVAALMAIGGISLSVFGYVRGSALVGVVGGLAIVIGLGLGLAVWLRRSGRDDRALVLLFTTVWGVVTLNESLLLPRFDLYRPHAEMARRVNARVSAGETLDLVEIPHPQVLFYLRFPFRRFGTLEDYAVELARGASRTGPPRTVITGAGVSRNFDRLGQVDPLDRSHGRTPLSMLSLQPNALRIAETVRLSSEGVMR